MCRYLIISILFSTLFILGCQSPPEDKPTEISSQAITAQPQSQEQKENKKDGCSPEFRAMYDNAIVELHGTGDLDIVVLTDPLCWHCRLGHKLLMEYPDKYRTLRMSFFPRKSFIGSDMAAWILEEAVGTPDLEDMVKFAYNHLKQPNTEDLNEAREVVLGQFLMSFPQLMKAGEDTLEATAARLQADHEPHVLKSAALADAVNMPGTPILIAGRSLVLGYGAGAWIKALDEKAICE